MSLPKQSLFCVNHKTRAVLIWTSLSCHLLCFICILATTDWRNRYFLKSMHMYTIGSPALPGTLEEVGKSFLPNRILQGHLGISFKILLRCWEIYKWGRLGIGVYLAIWVCILRESGVVGPAKATIFLQNKSFTPVGKCVWCVMVCLCGCDGVSMCVYLASHHQTIQISGREGVV